MRIYPDTGGRLCHALHILTDPSNTHTPWQSWTPLPHCVLHFLHPSYIPYKVAIHISLTIAFILSQLLDIHSINPLLSPQDLDQGMQLQSASRGDCGTTRYRQLPQSALQSHPPITSQAVTGETSILNIHSISNFGLCYSKLTDFLFYGTIILICPINSTY